MSTTLIPLLGGVAGTVVMTIFLFIPRWLGLGNVDVVRAVGALITRKVDNAMAPGIAVHFVSGIIFAYIYTFLLRLSDLPLNIWSYSMAGAIHGVIVMLLVSMAIMEHHPIARYHDRGPMTGVAQLFAHLLYGATVGVVYQILAPAA